MIKKLEQTLDEFENKLYIESMREYRKTETYHQVKSLDSTLQYKNNVVAEIVAQGYAKGKVLAHRELNAEIQYRNKYFKQQYWDGD